MASILFGIVRICDSLFSFNYLKDENLFPNFLFHLWNPHQIFNIFEKKMIVIGNLLPKVQSFKDLVKKLSCKRCFRISFDSQRVNGYQTLEKSTWEHFYHMFWLLWVEMLCKISPLFIFEILGVFVNTLTADDKYPLRDSESFPIPIQMQLP